MRLNYTFEPGSKGNFVCIFLDYCNKLHHFYMSYIHIILRMYLNLGYPVACNMLIKRCLECEIEWMTTEKLSDMKVS